MRILDTQILYSSPGFKRVRYWIEGIYPELGTIINGITGWETVRDVDVIEVRRFTVLDHSTSAN